MLTEVPDGDVSSMWLEILPAHVRHALAVTDHVSTHDSPAIWRSPADHHWVRERSRCHVDRLARHRSLCNYQYPSIIDNVIDDALYWTQIQPGSFSPLTVASAFYFTAVFTFYARQHICYSAYMPSPVRPSVRLSVCHTGGSVENGWT